MFSLQSVTSWHNFMLLNDNYYTVAVSLGASPNDVYEGWRPVQGWLSVVVKCGQRCDVLRGILRGDLLVTPGLTVKTLMQHVFALSGAPLLLLIR